MKSVIVGGFKKINHPICVIIPMFNFFEMIKKCVSVVLRNAGIGADILVVDDGSCTSHKDPRVNILRLEKNTGFTNAVNQGILWCGDRYKYVHILNNDTEPEEDFLKVLYDHMEAYPSTGIAHSVRLVRVEGKEAIEMYGLDLLSGYQAIRWGWDSKDTDVIYCDWAPLCSTLIRVKMVRYIGLLDGRFKNHCSDGDYCIRARQDGWQVTVLPTSKVGHAHQITTHHCGIEPYDDQKEYIAKIAGMQYQELVNRVPLDYTENIWGEITFDRIQKEGKIEGSN